MAGEISVVAGRSREAGGRGGPDRLGWRVGRPVALGEAAARALVLGGWTRTAVPRPALADRPAREPRPLSGKPPGCGR